MHLPRTLHALFAALAIATAASTASASDATKDASKDATFSMAPVVARVKLGYRSGLAMLKTHLQPMPRAKATQSKPAKARHIKIPRREVRPPSKSGRPGPAETGRAPNHRPL
jgi:hypothetical protein